MFSFTILYCFQLIQYTYWLIKWTSTGKQASQLPRPSKRATCMSTWDMRDQSLCHEARDLLVAHMLNLVGSLKPAQNISDKLCGFPAGRNPPRLQPELCLFFFFFFCSPLKVPILPLRNLTPTHLFSLGVLRDQGVLQRAARFTPIYDLKTYWALLTRNASYCFTFCYDGQNLHILFVLLNFLVPNVHLSLLNI